MGWLFTALIAGAVMAGLAHVLGWFKKPVDYRRPRILMYHMISPHRPGAQFNKLRVPPNQFEQQLAWLKENGWHFYTMRELQALAPNFPEKAVALTFDDGFEDNYTHALPIMQKYGAKGTLYLVIDRHNNDWSTKKKAHHDSGELMREPKLSDAQVAALLDSGLFELGGHTFSHANLATIDTTQKAHEIAASRAYLERTFKTSVTSFAYPFGIYTERDPELVAQAGFLNAVTTVEGVDDKPSDRWYELKRVKISGKDNLSTFCKRIRFGNKK